MKSMLTGSISVLLCSLLTIPAFSQDELSKKSAAVVIQQAIDDSGIEAATDTFNKIKTDSNYDFKENQFLRIGYDNLWDGKTKEAVGIFEMASEMFPESVNICDSLAESYYYDGNEDLGMKTFEKTVSMLKIDESTKEKVWKSIKTRIFDIQNETKARLKYKPGEQTGLQGPYLGQKVPGLEPEIFAPGIVSIKGGHEFSGTFSPDGKEFYFNRGIKVRVCYWKEDGWTAPELAPFNTPMDITSEKAGLIFNSITHEPHITADGKRMFFGSNRQRPDKKENEMSYGIWVMERQDGKWGEPKFFTEGMSTSSEDDGTLVIGGPGMFKPLDGGYGEPQGLLKADGSRLMVNHPCIARDGSYLIYDTNQPGGPGGIGDFYISFRNSDGTWSDGVNMGDKINSIGDNIAAFISPDGKYLFFSSKKDIYWVSTQIVEQFRPKTDK